MISPAPLPLAPHLPSDNWTTLPANLFASKSTCHTSWPGLVMAWGHGPTWTEKVWGARGAVCRVYRDQVMYSYIYIYIILYIYIYTPPLSLSLAISEFGSASGRSEQVKVVALISGTTVRTCKVYYSILFHSETMQASWDSTVGVPTSSLQWFKFSLIQGDPGLFRDFVFFFPLLCKL